MLQEKHQVHMVPTEQHSQLGLYNEVRRNPLVTAKEQGWDYIQKQSYITPQYLYIISDEEIKEGDWIIISPRWVEKERFFVVKVHSYSKTSSTIRYQSAIPNEGILTSSIHEQRMWKIVATTNPELWNKPEVSGNFGKVIKGFIKGVPKIEEDFVSAYVKAYNEGNPIKEVMLDYETIYSTSGSTRQELDNNQISFNSIKLRNNSTVIIHPVKEQMYTRTEMKACVASLINEFSLYVMENDETIQMNSFNLKQWFETKYPSK